MQDLWNFKPSSSYTLMISPSETWEGGTNVNEGAIVFKYRNCYYMLYNAYNTAETAYCLGCVEAANPTAFSNSGKYKYAVLNRKTWPGSGEINTIGGPWLLEGLNGFERWIGYFAIYNFQFTDGGRRQSIDRVHFFNRTLFIDGPTSPYATGYHPGPAQPQYRGILNCPDGPMRSEDWMPVGSGNWFVTESNQACQNQQDTFSFNTINRAKATNYLIEANVRFSASGDSEDKAGVLAYYKDDNNWMVVGLNRTSGTWYYATCTNGQLVTTDAPWSGLNYTIYHKIRVTKNGPSFGIRIDDQIPPSYNGPINTNFNGRGIPGIYTDHTEACFAGILYTIGWDEYDGLINGWGNSLTLTPSSGTWTVGSSGLTQSNATGEGIIFKGDLMGNYEFCTQIYEGSGDTGLAGIYPVYIDSNNYMRAMVNFASDMLVVDGKNRGSPFFQQASVADATNYNLRAVKLSDKVILC
jgi:hypothetical protein